MSVKIIKKNNTVQEFNSEKIINAVRKSADRACTRLTNEQENAIVDYVLNYLKLNNIDAIEVNKLHNIVENALESVDSKAAKCYRNYRNYKTTFAEMIDHVYRKKLELSETRDNSNANADSSLVTTQKAITYSELNGELYKRFFLTDEERQAMQDGYIYIHDRGARLDTTNCCLMDVKNIFKGGFKMGNIDYREPRTIGTAISLMTDIMLNAGAAQYGGLTVSNVDSVLAQYAENSYNDYYNEYIENYSRLCDNVNNEKLHQLADEYAIDKVRKEIRDGFIEIECRLNSTTTARGDFIFSSISFGLDTTRFGSLISSEILNVRKNSLGTKTGIPVLFPKLTFMYDENLHGEGKQLEWLFLEAVDCTMRAQYPDFLSMDGGKPAYKITYKDGTSEIVDEKTYKEIKGKEIASIEEVNQGYAPSMYKKYGVTISRMGCVHPKENVIYKYNNKLFSTSIENMWLILSANNTIHSQKERGYTDDGEFIPLTDVTIYDGDQFVECKQIIKNTPSNDWYKVTLHNGYVITVTADHPWSIGNTVKPTIDLKIGDTVEAINKLADPESILDNKSISTIVSIDKLDITQESYDVTTSSEHFYCSGIRSHNCRANLSPWYERGGIEPADEFDKPIYEGRFNCGALSLHFPMIVAKAKAEGKDFFDVLEYYLQLCRKIHIRTLDFLSHKKAGINPLAFCEGGFYNGNKKPDEEIGRDFLKPATVSFGITALNEATVMYNGKTIYEDNSEFADKVLQYINDFANKYKKEDGILYAIYGTPAESLCFCSGTIVQCYNGNKEIQNIKAGDLVYSYNENLNKIELKPVVASSCTSQTAKVVKIHFTNGQELVCTPNHPFAVRKKDVYNHREVIRYIAAKDLTRGLRIKSNYIRLVHGRHRFTTQQYEHDIVAEYFYGKKPAGYIVHHIDENKLNNQKENLVYMSDADHRILHMKDTILPYCYTSKSQKGANNTFYGKHHTSKSIQLNREKHLGKNNVCSKEVAQYTLDDVLINIFESRSIAEASTGFKNISNACNGISTNAKGNHVAYNFKWYYTKDIKNFACENHVVESVEFLEDRIPVYNIEVADNHNYFVGGDNGVLVHNCALQVQQFRKKYGIIKGVSDREYTTNSFHMHVTEDISPIEKQDAEYKCFHKCNGGNIMYNRFTSEYNKKAYIDLIRRAMRLGYYYGCNKQQNFCEHCGAEFIDAQKCPKCGSEDITQIDRVCGYLGYTRIKGYSMMNSGKVAEIRDRKSM